MTWSLSRLKTYETCHAKFNYRYNLGAADTYRSPQADRGIDLHKGIENAILGTGPLPQQAVYLESYINGLAGQGHILVRPEFRIELARGWQPTGVDAPVWYVGILDLLSLDKSAKKATVDDWKSGKIYPDHGEQRQLYAIATFRLYPELEEVLTQFHYFDLSRTNAVTFFRYHVDPTIERWNQRVEKMEQETEFMPMPGFHCRYCSFSNARGGPCRF